MLMEMLTTVSERVVSTRWNSLTGSHAWGELTSEELEDSIGGQLGKVAG